VLGYLAIVYEFDDGTYYDPFYHWTDLAMRELCFESYDYVAYLRVASVADLAHKSFDFEDRTWTGIFSNSLDPVVRTVRFGAYSNGKIACALTFSLTNTESYGMMSGTLEEHLRSSKTIDMELTCLELDEGKCRGLQGFAFKAAAWSCGSRAEARVAAPTAGGGRRNETDVRRRRPRCATSCGECPG
jgi:hypothetical protein